jgi:hypothetical protein
VGTALTVAFTTCAAVGRGREQRLKDRSLDFSLSWWEKDAYARSASRYRRLAIVGFAGLGISFASLVIPGGSMAIHGHSRLKAPGAWIERFVPPEQPFQTSSFFGGGGRGFEISLIGARGEF